MLDESLWGFSRYGHQGSMFFVRNPANTVNVHYPEVLFPPVFCGQPFEGILPDDDVAICDGIGADGETSGQLNEVFDDQGDFGFNSMMIRQPFDFTDRVGMLVFEVDAKINPYNAGHGWWVEFWVTEDPAPMPYHGAPGVDSFPRAGVGFSFQGCDEPNRDWGNRLTRLFVTQDYQIIHDLPGWELDAHECFDTADLKQNRFKLLLSQDTAEVWVSNADDPTTLNLVTKATGLDLSFTRGYVHLQHSQYNAHKDGAFGCFEAAAELPGADITQCPTPTQTYRWDNVGFDGPMYAVPRAYEVQDFDGPDADGLGGRQYGYYLTDQDWRALEIHDVDLSGEVTRAHFNFSLFTLPGRALEYRFNGGETHSFTAVGGYEAYNLRAFSVELAPSELIAGTNTIELRMVAPQTYEHEAVANLDVTLEVAP
jgi:hypothetical protein